MPLEHERHVLPCGTTVLARRLDVNDIVVVRAFLPMGVLYERDEEAGISSLVQGVLSRGTHRRSADAIQEELAGLGANLDASAGQDLGSVSLRATRPGWEAALDVWTEVLTELSFPAEEVETEIEQTLGAIDAREDQLSARVVDLFRDLYYGDHPYHKPALGTRETVRAQITRSAAAIAQMTSSTGSDPASMPSSTARRTSIGLAKTMTDSRTTNAIPTSRPPRYGRMNDGNRSGPRAPFSFARSTPIGSLGGGSSSIWRATVAGIAISAGGRCPVASWRDSHADAVTSNRPRRASPITAATPSSSSGPPSPNRSR